MGCISSKALCRSISIREEVSHGFQSSASAWEELITSNGRKDHLFALLSSSKLTATNFQSTDVKTEYDLSNNSSGLVPDFDGVAEGGLSPDHGDGEPELRRSKSCQLNENKLDRNDKNMIGSRSFHTVEEYDALLERIHNMKDEYSWEDIKLRGSNSVDKTPKNESCNRDHELKNSDDVENGWKRKAVAKGLKSLDVPSIEFPAVARFKQRVRDEGQVFSPTTSYVTPRFGSYNVGPAQEKEGRESRVFSPELVAAFEDCMQQLQVEEESILREMEKGGH